MPSMSFYDKVAGSVLFLALVPTMQKVGVNQEYFLCSESKCFPTGLLVNKEIVIGCYSARNKKSVLCRLGDDFSGKNAIALMLLGGGIDQAANGGIQK